jgi:hypothetical protein
VIESRHSAFTVRVETIKASVIALSWWGTQLKAFWCQRSSAARAYDDSGSPRLKLLVETKLTLHRRIVDHEQKGHFRRIVADLNVRVGRNGHGVRFAPRHFDAVDNSIAATFNNVKHR